MNAIIMLILLCVQMVESVFEEELFGSGRICWLKLRHTIWETPDGELIDVTPNSYNEDHILFLEVPNMTYDGMVIGNIRLPLTNSPCVKELIGLCEEMEAILSSTKEKYVTMPVDLVKRRQELTRQISRPAGRNDSCPCGSGIKLKNAAETNYIL